MLSKLSTIALILCSLAGQAAGLSCGRADPVDSFKSLMAFERSFVVVHGTLTFDQSALRRTGLENGYSTAAHPTPAQLTGRRLTPAGFSDDFDAPITLLQSCRMGTCGNAISGLEALYYVLRDDDEFTIHIGACTALLGDALSPALAAMLMSCVAGGPCEPVQ